MEAEAVWELITTYGIPPLVISCTIIFLVGILKFFGVFDKIQKDWKKAIIYTIDIALSFGLVALYNVIFKVPFGNYIWYSLGTNTLTIALYAFYEHYGLRNLLKTIGNFVVKKVANKQVADAVKNITDAIPAETAKTTTTTKTTTKK